MVNGRGIAGRSVLAALGAFALAGLGSEARAQTGPDKAPDAASPPASTVQEVIVTATRRDIEAQKVGVSLTVVGQQELARIAPTRLDDLRGLAPNVFIGEAVGAPNQSVLFIRGQGYADVEMDQATPVGVIQDGVPFGTSTGQLASMFDVCSVEVDRGPQGIFFGKNTTAGLINITRCRPKRAYAAEVSAGFGSYNDAYLRGVFNAPLGDKGGVKLSTQYHSNDGYVKNQYNGKHLGGDHMFALNAVVDYDLTNWLNVNFSYDHIAESGRGNPVQYGNTVTASILATLAETTPSALYPNYNAETGSPIGLKPRQVNLRPGAVSDTYQNDVGSLILKAKTPVGDLVSQTAYLDQSDSDYQDYDGTCVTAPGCTSGGNVLIAGGALPLETPRFQTFRQFTQELRLSGSVGPFDYLVGAFYYHHDFSLRQITDLFVVQYNQQSSQADDSWSEFANLDWNVIPNVKLSAGLRNISETKDAQTEFSYLNGPVLVPQLNFNKTWNHVVTRFNAQWQATPDTMVYANRSEGFRSGGFSVRGTLSETQPSQPNYVANSPLIAFQPETNTTYEIGIKNRFFNNGLTFNIDGFINDIDNFQQTSVVTTTGYGPGTNTYVINIPKVEIKGVEMEFTLRPGRWVDALEGLTLAGNVGIQSGDIDNGKVNGRQFATKTGAAGAPGTIADLTGTDLARLPANNFTLRGTYEHAMGPNGGKLTASVGYAWTARYALNDFTPQSPDFQPSYGLLDASLTYEWKNYHVKVSGRNLTNEDYRQFSLPTVFIQSWAPPATAQIEVGAKF